MATALPVLIVSSQASHRERVAEVVRKCRLRPIFSPSLADALSILKEMRPSMVFCGDDLQDSDLRAALRTLTAAADAPVIALSRLAEWESCVEAMSAGAFDYIACPPDAREIERVLGLALEQGRALDARHSAA